MAHTLVRSFLVIVIHERADDGSEMFLAEWHDAVQALGLVGTEDPDIAFGLLCASAPTTCTANIITTDTARIRERFIDCWFESTRRSM